MYNRLIKGGKSYNKRMNLLETRIEIKKGVGGTKVKDPGVNPWGVVVII